MIYVICLFVLFGIQLAYFRIADYFNIIDKPNQRSSHSSITLRGGGVIFYVGVLIYFVMNDFQYLWFVLGFSLISIISFADDVKPQSSKLRLGIHFVAMLFMFYQVGIFEFPWYFTLLSLVLATGILNAYNFMDGINGITGLYSIVVLLALWYINSFEISFVDNQLIYLLLMALSVFNFFNVRKKAKCFAGDVGSMSIAFSIIFMLGMLIAKTSDFSYILLLAVYGVDTVLTIIHRLILKENIFEAHRKHLYQLLANELKIPHVIVASIYGFLQALIVVGLIVFKSHLLLYTFAVLFVCTVLYIVLKKKYFYLHLRKM